MFSGIVRNMFTITNTGVMQQGMKTTSESLSFSIFRSFSRSLQTYESDHRIVVTESAGISGCKIGRVMGEVLGKCSLLCERDTDAISRASDICKYNARQNMIESAQRMNANAIVSVRYRDNIVMETSFGTTVESWCRGDAVIVIKDES